MEEDEIHSWNIKLDDSDTQDCQIEHLHLAAHIHVKNNTYFSSWNNVHPNLFSNWKIKHIQESWNKTI